MNLAFFFKKSRGKVVSFLVGQKFFVPTRVPFENFLNRPDQPSEAISIEEDSNAVSVTANARLPWLIVDECQLAKVIAGFIGVDHCRWLVVHRFQGRTRSFLEKEKRETGLALFDDEIPSLEFDLF